MVHKISIVYILAVIFSFFFLYLSVVNLVS